MGEEIFGDKSPHQVSVSEGSGNAGSSRNRSGKFKADTSRRISVDADEGEMVSRHISSDGETHVTGGPGRNNPDPLAAQPENGHPGGAQQNTGDDRTGPMLGREGLSDRSLSVSEGSAEENRQALPGNEAQATQRLRIPATDAADNQQLLPDTDAAAPNLARLPAQGDVSNRIALPDRADSDAGQGPIIQADGSRHSPSVTGTGSAPASGPAIEPSNYPHAAPLAKSDPTDHHEGLVSVGHSDNKVPVQGAGLADRHVPCLAKTAMPTTGKPWTPRPCRTATNPPQAQRGLQMCSIYPPAMGCWRTRTSAVLSPMTGMKMTEILMKMRRLRPLTWMMGPSWPWPRWGKKAIQRLKPSSFKPIYGVRGFAAGWHRSGSKWP